MARLYEDSDKYGYQSDFPIVEAYNSAVKDLVRNRFDEAGVAWDEFVADKSYDSITLQDLENIEERDNFLEYTNGHSVMTRPMWTPVHTLPMYRNCIRGDLTVSESIESRLVNIPSSVI